MIGMILQGGLGNQLFQYAAAKALATESEPILDIRLLENDKQRSLSLTAYPIKATIVDFSALHHPSRLKRLYSRLLMSKDSIDYKLFYAKHYKENDSFGCFDESINSLTSPILLSGYFQSERYFNKIENQIRSEIIPLRKPSNKFEFYKNLILKSGVNSVSIHIRRGDYLSNPKTQAFHGILDFDYYSKCLNIIQNKIHYPNYFIFTDTPEIVSSIFPYFNNLFLISGNGLTDIDELQLMSLCNHHIIANSSFSWWGAWLGSPTGTTIAPRKWFANNSSVSIRDRFPSHWYIV